MTLEEERVEVPFDERDQLVEAARWFSEDPDSMGAWRALNDAVEATRPVHTDPLDDAVRTIASLREDKADPQTIARAFLDLQGRLRAVKPLEVASLVNPNPPGVQWLIDGWLRSGDGPRCSRETEDSERAGLRSDSRQESRRPSRTGSVVSLLPRTPKDGSCISTLPPTS